MKTHVATYEKLTFNNCHVIYFQPMHVIKNLRKCIYKYLFTCIKENKQNAEEKTMNKSETQKVIHTAMHVKKNHML